MPTFDDSRREAPAPAEGNGLTFFSENVDSWGPANWFDRLAKAVRGQDRAVLANDDIKFEICKNVVASSAMRLVRDYEQQVHAALAARPDTAEARLREALAYARTCIWNGCDTIEALKIIDKALSPPSGGDEGKESEGGKEPRGCPTPGACSCPSDPPADRREIVAQVPVDKLIEWASDFEAGAHEVPRGIKATVLMTRAQEVRTILAALDGGR